MEDTPLRTLFEQAQLVKWRPLIFVPLDPNVDYREPILSRDPFVPQAERQTHEYQASVKWPEREPSTVHKGTRRNWAETSTVNQIAYNEAKSGLEPWQRHMIQAVLEEGHTRKEAGEQIGLKPSQAGSVARQAAEALWAEITRK